MLLTLSFLILGLSGSAQIKVNSGGKVSMDGAEPDDMKSLYIYNTQTNSHTHGISVKKSPASTGKTFGIYSTITGEGHGLQQGIRGNVYNSSPSSNGRSYGLRGMAGNYTDGYNYGVYGKLYGDNNGTAIYGTTHSDSQVGEIQGKYAGYFWGDVEVDGILTIEGRIVTASDERLKENIHSLGESDNSANKLIQLKPVKYNLKSPRPRFSEAVQSDTGSVVQKIDTTLLNRKHIGFIAQEMAKVYPELVYTNDEGVMGINYNGLIPVLVEAFKEQQIQFNQSRKQIEEDSSKIRRLEEQIAFLEDEINYLKKNCCTSSAENSTKNTALESENTEKATEQGAKLYQNAPNPFSDKTIIDYYLPTETENANLYIYNMQGRQIRSYPVYQSGEGNSIIQGSEMEPGMYMYTLVADGKEVDTKKMILTRK